MFILNIITHTIKMPNYNSRRYLCVYDVMCTPCGHVILRNSSRDAKSHVTKNLYIRILPPLPTFTLPPPPTLTSAHSNTSAHSPAHSQVLTNVRRVLTSVRTEPRAGTPSTESSACVPRGIPANTAIDVSTRSPCSNGSPR